MSESKVRSALVEARKNITRNRLGCAMRSLRGCMLLDSRLSSLDAPLRSIESVYKYMADYMMDGGSDPDRKKYYDTVREDMNTLYDRFCRELDVAESTELYYSQVRTLGLLSKTLQSIIVHYRKVSEELSMLPHDVQNAEKQAERERLLKHIFNYVWTTFPLTANDLTELVGLASDEQSDFAVRSHIIVALFLGCVKYYERGRIEAMMDIYDRSSNVGIKARALMSAILAAYAHSKRVSCDDKLAARFGVWIDNPDNAKRLRTVIMDIIRTMDTDRINKSMKEDFIPALQKMKPELDSMLKNGSSPTDIEGNPEWEELMEKSGVGKKLREFSELQSEGADMMMFAFSKLKGFAFFNELSNWFLPFDENHTQILSMKSAIPSSILSLLSVPGAMCDSDKYSFVFSLEKLPQSHRDAMFSQLQQQEEVLRQSIEEATLSASASENLFANESLRYIRDLNRFLKLFKDKSQFEDVLCPPFSVGRIPFMGNTVTDDAESVQMIGEFYLKRKYYPEAEAMFRRLGKIGGEDASLLEKLGYTLQQQGKYGEALTQYRKAELFNSDSLWLAKRVAGLCRRTGAYEDAVEYYDAALRKEPDNEHLLMGKGISLTKLNRYDEALKVFYQMRYVNEQNVNALRSIAWCEYMLGDYGKSIGSYMRVIDSVAEPVDYINLGHAYLLSGNYKKCLEVYLKSVSMAKDTVAGIKYFLRNIKDDYEQLAEKGCDKTALNIIVDKVCEAAFVSPAQ